MKNNFKYLGFDLKLAVQACRILFIETHPQVECLKMIFEPTRQALKKFALESPSIMLCMRSPVYSCKGLDGTLSDVHVVLSGKKVFYLATIMSQQYAMSELKYYQAELEIMLRALQDLKDELSRTCMESSEQSEEKVAQAIRYNLEIQESSARHKLEMLKHRGKNAITFDRVGCRVPVDSDNLDIPALTQGVKRYLQAFVPQLGKTDVSWMPPKLQQSLRKFIREKAEHVSVPQTFEERRNIAIEDFS